MLRKTIFALLLMTVLLTAANAQAQQVIVYQPIPQPVVVAAPVVPAPVVVQRPVVVRQPVTVYRRSVAPYRTYYAPAPAPVVVAQPVVVRQKVYVAGQPVRNVLRAITP